jgi:uncharacterized membrane protein
MKWSLAWIAPAIVAHSLLIALTVSLLTLAISALSRSARIAGLALAGFVVGLEIVRGVLAVITDRPEAHVLSIQNCLRIVGDLIFGIEHRGAPLPAAYPPIALALLAVGCLLVLRKRVRAVEIVT